MVENGSLTSPMTPQLILPRSEPLPRCTPMHRRTTSTMPRFAANDVGRWLYETTPQLLENHTCHKYKSVWWHGRPLPSRRLMFACGWVTTRLNEIIIAITVTNRWTQTGLDPR